MAHHFYKFINTLKTTRKPLKRLYITNIGVYLHPLSEKKVIYIINKLIKTFTLCTQL
jgi:hypothetical protein